MPSVIFSGVIFCFFWIAIKAIKKFSSVRLEVLDFIYLVIYLNVVISVDLKSSMKISRKKLLTNRSLVVLDTVRFAQLELCHVLHLKLRVKKTRQKFINIFSTVFTKVQVPGTLSFANCWF